MSKVKIIYNKFMYVVLNLLSSTNCQLYITGAEDDGVNTKKSKGGVRGYYIHKSVLYMCVHAYIEKDRHRCVSI